MTHRVWRISLAVLAFASATVSAQQGTTAQSDRMRSSAPQDTDITLPETFLEVEEVLIERVEAVLPRPADLLPAVQAVPLPTEEELRISDALFDIPAIDDPSFRPDGGGESSFFSDGVLGTGSNYHILGSLTLFKLGTDPRFRFQFAHESIDGYQFTGPGRGFFEREDLIEGWIASSVTARSRAEGDARFFQREIGLQNQPDLFYSAGHRSLSGSATWEYSLFNRMTLGVQAESTYVERIFTVKDPALDPPRQDEISVQPAIALSFRNNRLLLRADGGYEYRSFGGGDLTSDQAGAASLTAEVSVRDALFLEATGGTRISAADGLLFPFRVAATANLDDTFTLSVEGGYRVVPQRFFDLWQRFPLLSFGPEDRRRPTSERAWYGAVNSAWATSDRRVSLEAGAEFAVRSYALNLAPYDAVADATFGFLQEEQMTVTPEAVFTWRPGLVQFTAGWQANLLDRPVFAPAQSLHAGLEAIHPSERFGVNVAARADLFDDATLPHLGAGGFFNVARGVQFQLELRDLLAPALSDGRPQIGSDVSSDFPFIEPGFRVILKANVSL